MVVECDLADNCAAVGPGLEVAFLLHLREGFAHGGSAYAKLHREIAFHGQPVPGLQLAREDQIRELFGYLLVQLRFLQRCKHGRPHMAFCP